MGVWKLAISNTGFCVIVAVEYYCTLVDIFLYKFVYFFTDVNDNSNLLTVLTIRYYF